MLVKRDPFAREELHKESVTNGVDSKSCSWCGGHAKTSSGKKRLWQFRLETDGGSKYDIKGLFCSKSCFYTYHNR
jgi:hypothetical protein